MSLVNRWFPWIPAIAGLFLLGGCGYDYETFAGDVKAAHCYKYDECGYLDAVGWTLDQCLETDTGNDDAPETSTFECEDFDGDAAEQCIAAIDTVSCEDYYLDEGLEICDDVCSND